MIVPNNATLLRLTGDVRLKQRVQHPRVEECRDRQNPYWFFRYRGDELLPDGTAKTSRKRHIIGPSRGPNAIGKKQAEIERDKFLAESNAATSRCESAAMASKPPELGAILFGKLAEMWRRDFVEREVGGRALIAASTRAKYLNHLDNHIMPRWKDTRIAEFRTKDVLDWLQCECESWHTMADLRNIMSGVFHQSAGVGNSAGHVRQPDAPRQAAQEMGGPGKAHSQRRTDRRGARPIGRPHLLICETCLDTGTRISEVTGLKVKHVDLDQGCIRIEQRNWRGDIDEPKTAKSKRTLALGALRDRYRTWIASLQPQDPKAWVFPQDENKRQPMWDSGVRSALKKAASAEGCDFPGLGPHSLRRANITWRQEVGGSSIETSQIAGHANTKMTEEYTVVQLRRQEELTRRIQNKRAKAGKRSKGKVVEIGSSDTAA